MLDVPAMSAIRALLKTPNKAIDPNLLMRAIVEHREWYLPLATLSRQGRDECDHIVLPVDGQLREPDGPLWLLSDREAVQLAPHQLGFGTISGLDLCASWDPAWELAHLNLGSPDSVMIGIPESVQGELARLARAVPLERMVSASVAGATRFLFEHPLFYILSSAGGRAAIAPAADKKITQGVLAFTAVDAVENVLNRMPAATRSSFQIGCTSGHQLFRDIGAGGMDGVFLNAAGPRGRAVVYGQQLAELVELANGSRP
jgi:hypothetical protein